MIGKHCAELMQSLQLGDLRKRVQECVCQINTNCLALLPLGCTVSSCVQHLGHKAEVLKLTMPK